MAAREDFRQALIDGDVRLLRRIWASVFPGHPQPKDAAEAETTLHIARTAAESIPLKLRAYSHRWLLERNLPSQLPDALKPKAEQLCPHIAEGVGIAMNTSKEWLKPALPLVRRAMERTVEDMFANGDRDPGLVKSRIIAARGDEMRRLFGAPTAKEIER